MVAKRNTGNGRIYTHMHMLFRYLNKIESLMLYLTLKCLIGLKEFYNKMFSKKKINIL